MHALTLKYFYTFGILLVYLNFAYAKESGSQYNIPANISTLIENVKQKDAILLIDKTLKKKKVNLLKTKKTDVLKYTSLYDEIAELMIVKHQLLIEMEKEDESNTDRISNFILDYEEVEFIKTQFYKTPFHDDVAKTVQNVASLYKLCHPPMAKKYLNSVLKIKENLYSKKSAESAKAHDALGDHSFIHMADFGKAIGYYEEAKKIRLNIYGANDPRTTENYGRLAMSMFYFGDKKNRAEKLLLRSVDIRKNSPTNNDFPLYRIYMDIGIYYSMNDEYTNSITYLKKALTSFKGNANSNYIMILSELSRIYLNKNDLQNSMIYAKEAHAKAKEFYKDSQHPQVVEHLRQMNEINDMIKKREDRISHSPPALLPEDYD